MCNKAKTSHRTVFARSASGHSESEREGHAKACKQQEKPPPEQNPLGNFWMQKLGRGQAQHILSTRRSTGKLTNSWNSRDPILPDPTVKLSSGHIDK